jgi:hypothetical protein
VTNPLCPSCGQELHLDPQRRGKCKACGEAFILNKNGRLYGPLVTETQARVESWFNELEYHTGGVQGFRRMEAELTERFGFRPPPTDVIWGLFQEAVLQGVTGLHFSMARFLVEEGKDPATSLKAHAKERLMELAQPSDLTTDEVEVQGGGCCAECEKLDGKILPVSEALRTNPLPNPACTHTESGFQFCTCAYGFVIDYGPEATAASARYAAQNGPYQPQKEFWKRKDFWKRFLR